MFIFNERYAVKQAIELWIKRYGLAGTQLGDKRGRKVGEELMALDTDKATSADVAEIIGSKSWSRMHDCSECGKENCECVQLGEPPDHESETAWICKDCLKKALQLFGDE